MKKARRRSGGLSFLMWRGPIATPRQLANGHGSGLPARGRTGCYNQIHGVSSRSIVGNFDVHLQHTRGDHSGEGHIGLYVAERYMDWDYRRGIGAVHTDLALA